MTLSSIIFVDAYPKLDLHGEVADIAKIKIDDFIKDNIKMKNEIIVIIHGIGSGILRIATNQVLSKHKKVLEHKTYYNNQGCTIVLLDIE